MGIQVENHCFNCKKSFERFEEVAILSAGKFIPAHEIGPAPWNKDNLEPKRHRHTDHVNHLPNKTSVYCKNCIGLIIRHFHRALHGDLA